MAAFGLKRQFETHWPREDDFRPRSSFQAVCLNQKCWCLIFVFSKQHGEALVNSTADVAGYNSYVIYHWALLQLSTPSGRLYSRKSQTKRDWNHLVLKVEILIDQNQVMLVPNMSCTLAQISHHDLVLHSKSMACSSGLLESIDTTTRLI